MAFPTVVATSVLNTGGNTTSHVVPLPTPTGGILANDLLIYFSGLDGNPALSYDRGFTSITDQATGGVVNMGVA